MIVIMRTAGRLACSTVCDAIYSCSLSAGAIVVCPWARDGLRICIWLVHGVLCVHSQMSALSSSAPQIQIQIQMRRPKDTFETHTDTHSDERNEFGAHTKKAEIYVAAT